MRVTRWHLFKCCFELYVWMCVTGMVAAPAGLWVFGTGVPDSCQLPGKGVRNWTPVLLTASAINHWALSFHQMVLLISDLSEHTVPFFLEALCLLCLIKCLKIKWANILFIYLRKLIDALKYTNVCVTHKKCTQGSFQKVSVKEDKTLICYSYITTIN